MTTPKLINGKDYNWADIKVMLLGKEITGITSVNYVPGQGNKPEGPQWEFYYRRGDRFFFRNRYGYAMVVDLSPEESHKLKPLLKKGMRMDISHHLVDKSSAESITVPLQL